MTRLIASLYLALAMTVPTPLLAAIECPQPRPNHVGLAPVPPPPPSDSTFTIDVAHEPEEGQNTFLDVNWPGNPCNYSAPPIVEKTFILPVTRKIGNVDLLFPEFAKHAKLIIYHRWSDRLDAGRSPTATSAPFIRFISMDSISVPSKAGTGGPELISSLTSTRYVSRGIRLALMKS